MSKKTYEDYYKEHLVLLDMYRCSTRYIHTQEFKNEALRDKYLQDFRELYQKYDNQLENKCKKTTGHGFAREDLQINICQNERQGEYSWGN